MNSKAHERLVSWYIRYRHYRKSRNQDVPYAVRLQRDDDKNPVIYITTSHNVPGGPYVFLPYWLREF